MTLEPLARRRRASEPHAETAAAFRRLAAGDLQALEGLYDREADALFALALWLTGSREDAADAVQEVFVKLAAGRRRLSRVRRPRPYLLAMARSAAIDRLRPLDFEAYRPAPVPDRENTALPILEAVERLEEGSGDDSWREEMGAFKQINRLAAGAWSAGDVARARDLVASRPEALALLHRAAGRAGSSYRLDYAAGPEMEIPNLLMHLQGADLLFSEARLAWLDRRPEDAVRSVEALAALRRALETEAPLIFQLIGQAVEVLQYRAIQDGLAVGGLGPEALRRLRTTTEGTARAELLRRSVGAEGSMVFSFREGGPHAESFARTRGYYGRLQHLWLADGWVGEVLSYCSIVVEAFPSVPYAGMLDHPALLRRPPTDRALLVVDLRSTLGIFQGTEALARLARLALDLALAGAEGGSLPEELPATPEAGPGPFVGIAPAYERSAGGSATITVPGADDLWRDLKAGRVGRDREAPLFTWKLAPPVS